MKNNARFRAALLAACALAGGAVLARAGEAEEIYTVDPLTGAFYSAAELKPPKPKPVVGVLGADGRLHYPTLADMHRELVENLAADMSSEGAFVSTRDELVRVLHAMLDAAPDDLLQRMQGHLRLVIVPNGRSVGSFVADDRGGEPEEGLCGLAVPDAHGRWSVYIPENNLIVDSGLDNCGKRPRETAVHEIAHAVHFIGMSDVFDERWGPREITVQRMYGEARRGGAVTDAYAKTNAGEYFAQAATVWFGLHADKDPEWIKSSQPELYGSLDTIFGAPHPIGPR